MNEYPVYSGRFAPLQEQIDFARDAAMRGIATVESVLPRIHRLDITFGLCITTARKSGDKMVERKKNKRFANITIKICTEIYQRNHCGRFRKAIKHFINQAPKDLFKNFEIELEISEPICKVRYQLKQRCTPLNEAIAQEYFKK